MLIFCLQIKEKDLKPNGRNIPVTNENKHEYIKCVMFIFL